MGLVVVAEASAKASISRWGMPPTPKALHDDAVVEAENVGDQIGAEAGRQLEQKDAGLSERPNSTGRWARAKAHTAPDGRPVPVPAPGNSPRQRRRS